LGPRGGGWKKRQEGKRKKKKGVPEKDKKLKTGGTGSKPGEGPRVLFGSLAELQRGTWLIEEKMVKKKTDCKEGEMVGENIKWNSFLYTYE